jgi:hypothetical protein
MKIGKLALAASVAVTGSVLLSGCASNEPQEPPQLETTVDLLHQGPNTFPQYNHDMIFGYPYQAGWTVESLE